MSVAPGRDRRGSARRAGGRRAHRPRAAGRRLLRYVFPEHWSFMWGEIALYCFVVLVVTGIYLAVFFDPSLPRRSSTTVVRAAARRSG